MILYFFIENVSYLQVKWCEMSTPHSTTRFVNEMYDRLKETFDDYKVIICRWPEYTFTLENVSRTLVF